VRPAARACEASLRRLGTDRLDQYLLRWRGPVPLAENVEGVPIPVMAYSPIEQARILGNAVLRDIAARYDASPVQVALAWVLRQDGVCAIRGPAGRITWTRTARRSTSGWIAMTWPRWTRNSRRPFTRSRPRCSDGHNSLTACPEYPGSAHSV
jgi:hypothetical protein